MQASVRAKGVKPGPIGLLTILLVFAVGLAIGALAWNIFEDDSTGSSSQAESIAAGQDMRPASNVEPGEPNLTGLEYGADESVHDLPEHGKGIIPGSRSIDVPVEAQEFYLPEYGEGINP